MKVNVASGVELAGETKTVAVSVAAGVAVAGIPVSAIVTGSMDAGLGPHAESASKADNRIEKPRKFNFIVKVSVLEIIVAL